MIIKNSNLRRNIYKNRYKILAIIVGVILLFIIIQTLNQVAKSNLEKPKVNQIDNTYTGPQETVIQGTTVKKEQQEVHSNIINTFIEKCNNGKVEEAYEILTKECKIEMYPTLEYFKKNYWSTNFKTKKDFKIESWINDSENYTYKIKMYEDIMSTGKITESYIENYYTVVKVNGEEKLNINSYITNKQINKEQEKNNIKIIVQNKQIYMDYEIYKIKIENNTGKTIILDSMENQKTMYLSDKYDTTYSAYNYELNKNNLKIQDKYSSEISIKFNKIYKPNREAEKIHFSDVIQDYEEYIKYSNKTTYKDRLNIEIKI